ncbi:MAG TPA: endonuclease/exonuclease/phosphatase family protein [Paludibacteraceae bacterium]|mgnify:FL=1|nr:endonuclease/exonuclease/phosphatase family protein [Paludibacteraceae bacterium]
MKMNNFFKYFSFYALIFGFFLFSSLNLWASNEKKINVKIACVAFYNQENLFDTIDNENVNDYEFTPDGPNRWNSMKYKSKLEKMSYAISQIGLDVTPDGAAIIGVSEIENRGVLEDLVSQPSLKKRSYEIVHYDSPDRRGVDVALLYNPKYFLVTNSKSYRLHTADTTFRTRDQLMVSGYLFGEKIHVIVNHWPSRSGGEMRSRPKRNAAAALTRSIVDSLYRVDKNAKIIVMGDLNDDPFNESVAKVLGAKKNASEVKETELYNPFWKILDRGIGSLAYNDQWNLFDQIIISAPLLNAPPSELKFWKAEVFNRDFLIQKEGRYKGNPWRTFAGGVWLNGFSDHFPTLIYLIKEVDSQANEN